MLVGLLTGRDAGAACNLIPSAAKTFRGAIGATNRPFAAPGDFVEVGVEPGRCDAESPGIASAGDDAVVSVVFKPAGYQSRVVFITTASCGSGKIKSLREACESTPGLGVGTVTCVHASDTDLAVVERNGERRLAFRFPDTDALLPPGGDGRSLAGPAAIAVTAAGAALPCGLATSTCAAQAGTVACVDQLYDARRHVPAERRSDVQPFHRAAAAERLLQRLFRQQSPALQSDAPPSCA